MAGDLRRYRRCCPVLPVHREIEVDRSQSQGAAEVDDHMADQEGAGVAQAAGEGIAAAEEKACRSSCQDRGQIRWGRAAASVEHQAGRPLVESRGY